VSYTRFDNIPVFFGKQLPELIPAIEWLSDVLEKLIHERRCEHGAPDCA